MIIDTHTHVVSSDKVKHPLDPGARGWSTEVSNDVEDLITEMDKAGVECATLVQPAGTYGLDNIYQHAIAIEDYKSISHHYLKFTPIFRIRVLASKPNAPSAASRSASASVTDPNPPIQPERSYR